MENIAFDLVKKQIITGTEKLVSDRAVAMTGGLFDFAEYSRSKKSIELTPRQFEVVMTAIEYFRSNLIEINNNSGNQGESPSFTEEEIEEIYDVFEGKV
jgi:hypothetical protein